jgi:hypothetical protein
MTQHQIRQYAFDIFDKLRINQSIMVKDFAKKDPEAFIQYGKDYIDNGGGLVFNSDYSIITKTMSCQETASWIASLNQQSA